MNKTINQLTNLAEISSNDELPIWDNSAGDTKKVSVENLFRQYVRNQNVLSDLEVITISTDSSSPTEMEYDGVLYIQYPSAGSTPSYYYLNGTEVIAFGGGYSSARAGITFVVKKGDTVYCTMSGKTPLCNARFYKLRDYSDRQ